MIPSLHKYLQRIEKWGESINSSYKLRISFIQKHVENITRKEIVILTHEHRGKTLKQNVSKSNQAIHM